MEGAYLREGLLSTVWQAPAGGSDFLFMFRRVTSFVASTTLLICVCLTTSVGAATKHRANIMLFANAKLDARTCSLYIGVLNDKFFRELTLTRTKTATEFRNGNSIVDNYPDVTTVTVEASVEPCEDYDQSDRRSVLVKHADAMFGLKFDAHWEQDGVLTSISGVAVKETPPPLWHEYGSEYRGRYVIQVPSKGIPLTTTMVLCVSSPAVDPSPCMKANIGSRVPSAMPRAK
jgi:hypothetical protein